MAATTKFANPYRPGAGHMPTYLAGREHEKDEFKRLLVQETIFENLILTGLRGVGKTVLLETLKPLAIKKGWLWVGTDLSESASLSEERIATRLLADLAVVTATLVVGKQQLPSVGFARGESVNITLGYQTLLKIFNSAPGLVADKLKSILELVWRCLGNENSKGIVFAYDEAQNLSDHAARDQFPLSLILDVFQSVQKKNCSLMLALVGLPTLFPRLVEARTFSERMFHVLTLDRLNEKDSRDAILKPIDDAKCPVRFAEPGIQSIVAASGGYPYFIQFICREAYDTYLQNPGKGGSISEITRKLDTDFFMGRWSRATDRQRQLLWVVANLECGDEEFTLQEVAAKSHDLLEKGFSTSQISQMFNKLSLSGLVYKNRHGKYSFAVPLLGQFILRQAESGQSWLDT